MVPGPGLVHTRPGLDSGVGPGLVLRLAFGPGHRQAIERIEQRGTLARGPGPDAPHAADRELLTVLHGHQARKSWRETPVDRYGPKRVTADRNTDGWMRSRVRRLGKKARMLMEGGYRDRVAGR